MMEEAFDGDDDKEMEVLFSVSLSFDLARSTTSKPHLS